MRAGEAAPREDARHQGGALRLKAGGGADIHPREGCPAHAEAVERPVELRGEHPARAPTRSDSHVNPRVGDDDRVHKGVGVAANLGGHVRGRVHHRGVGVVADVGALRGRDLEGVPNGGVARGRYSRDGNGHLRLRMGRAEKITRDGGVPLVRAALHESLHAGVDTARGREAAAAHPRGIDGDRVRDVALRAHEIDVPAAAALAGLAVLLAAFLAHFEGLQAHAAAPRVPASGARHPVHIHRARGGRGAPGEG
mmetsp:Transcript_70051/g.222024  ORF Transcript_70051/g.222024 Transcript_70051/m.222024 type:complete len:253 (+) Transcript_70051:120-878(+)